MKRIATIITVCALFSYVKSVQNDQSEVVFGIDVSHYQTIDWDELVKQKKHPIEFIIVRATMGTRQDQKFAEYFYLAKKNAFMVGAYHYYDPNENSEIQAWNYINRVSSMLEAGDIIPILDIERISRVQSNDQMIIGLKNWIRIVEEELGVKPMIYTSLKFWDDYLKNDFPDHPLWLASYSSCRRVETRELCHIHQFTEDVKIHGIKELVDGNDTKRDDLNSLLIK